MYTCALIFGARIAIYHGLLDDMQSIKVFYVSSVINLYTAKKTTKETSFKGDDYIIFIEVEFILT